MRLRLTALVAFLFAESAAAQVPSVRCAQVFCEATPTAAVGYPTGVAGRIPTHTNVPANTSTIVCPATANVTAQTIQSQAAGGVGLNGQTLTSGTYATGAGSPDQVLAAGGVYTSLTPPTNATTFYSTTGGIVLCVQETRP